MTLPLRVITIIATLMLSLMLSAPCFAVNNEANVIVGQLYQPSINEQAPTKQQENSETKSQEQPSGHKEDHPAPTATPVIEMPNFKQPDMPNHQGFTVKPITPEQFSKNVDSALGDIFKMLQSPIKGIAYLMLLIAGIMIIVGGFNKALASKGFTTIICVAMGLLIFANIDLIMGFIFSLSKTLGGG